MLFYGATFVEVTLIDPNQRLEPDHHKDNVLESEAQSDATLALDPGPDVPTCQGRQQPL